MYASHDGVQQLVGVAGNATYLDENQRARLMLIGGFYLVERDYAKACVVGVRRV